MKIAVEFESLEEFEAFQVSGKKTRAKKAGEADDAPGAAGGAAPPPMQPPQGQSPGFNPGGFAPPAGGAGPGAGAFPAAGVSGPAPEVLALAQRISGRIDWALQPAPQGGGQSPDAVLSWFRSQLGPETAQYTMDQIKQVALPRAAQPVLENIAKLMAA